MEQVGVVPAVDPSDDGHVRAIRKSLADEIISVREVRTHVNSAEI
jgi:hypothetical protein